MGFRVVPKVALTGLVLVFGVVAVATGKPVGSEVEITSGEGTHFEGVVSSDSAKCLNKREVTLHYDTSGTDVGTAITDKGGHWSIEGSFIQGMYHAEVAPRKVHKT